MSMFYMGDDVRRMVVDVPVGETYHRDVLIGYDSAPAQDGQPPLNTSHFARLSCMVREAYAGESVVYLLWNTFPFSTEREAWEERASILWDS